MKKRKPKWLKEWKRKKKVEWEAGKESRKKDWLEERERLHRLDYQLSNRSD